MLALPFATAADWVAMTVPAALRSWKVIFAILPRMVTATGIEAPGSMALGKGSKMIARASALAERVNRNGKFAER